MAVALLVAAGRGERLGTNGPKAFVVVGGRPLLEWSLATLARVAEVEHVVVAVPGELAEHDELGGDGITVVAGGAVRSASVRNALAAAPPADRVVVHDAARPLASPALFAAVLAALDDADAAIAAAPVTDTVKRAGADHLVTATLDRAELWAVQTPQAFRRDALARALDVGDDVLAAATDDASLIERAGGRVRIVPAPADNLKVTTPADLARAEMLLQTSATLPVDSE